MASNLVAQLSVIAATSTNTLNTQKLRSIHSVSLLFPPSIAISQDIDAVFSIAIEGYRELCRLDKRFILYEKGLFSEHSKRVDRFVLPKPSAESLSGSIDGFLQLLCGRMLLQPALIALEWLVRHFRVQEQNTASFILCFLPYHDHPTLFKTMLSILAHKDLPKEFVFLTPYIQRPSPVPKHLITHALSHHREFLTLLCDHTISAVFSKRDSHQLVSFFSLAITAAASLMCDSISSNTSGGPRNGHTAENILTCTLPLLDQAFSAKSSPELETGCHMLTLVLVKKLSLTDTVLTAVIKSIVKHWSVESCKSGLTCVAYITQSRFRDDIELPDEVISALLKLDTPEFGNKKIVKEFLFMEKKFRVDKLAVALCLGILSRLGDAYNAKELRTVISLLEQAKLESQQRLLVAKKLVEAAQNLGGATTSGENTGDVRELLAESLVSWSGRERKGKMGKVLAQIIADDTIDVEELEMRLQTVIRPVPHIGSAKAKEITSEAPMQTQKPEDVISTLPDHTDEKSFLASHIMPLLQDLLRFFMVAVSSKRQREYITLAMFKDLPANSPLQISFLIECWTSLKYPTTVRSSALKICAEIIQDQTSKSSSVDYQAIIPHGLVALADPNRKVRIDAANLAKVLLKHYEMLEKAVPGDKPSKGNKPSKRKKKRFSAATQYWGLNSIYGDGKESEEVRWLELEQVGKLMEKIAFNDLFGCVEDPEYVGNMLAMVVGTGEGNSSSLKVSLKRSIFVFLSSHAVNVPLVEIRYRLLSIINHISVSEELRTTNLLPALIEWISVEDYNKRMKQCREERLDIASVEEQMVRVVNAGAPTILTDILTKNLSYSLNDAASNRIKDIWVTIKLDVQVELAEELLEIELSEEQPVSGVEILDRVRVPTAAFQKFFDKARAQLQTVVSETVTGPNKRRRTSGGIATNEAKVAKVEAACRRATVISDLLQIQGPEKHASLLKSLFGILADVASFQFSGISYLSQVLLDCMSSIVASAPASDGLIIDDNVRPDVLVECIRTASAPEVQNKAILLLASLADVVPERVQHSVMPIFTFMGANTLRRDDEYSAFVIEQTIKRIIPPLVKSLQAEGGDPVIGTAELVNTFVASYTHIPSHRRVRLFVALTKTLGAKEFLFAVIAKLGEKCLSTNAELSTGTEAIVTSACKTIAESFSIDVQLETIIRYLGLVVDVLNPRRNGLSKHLFESSKENKSQLAVRLLDLLVVVLRNKKLQEYLEKADDDGDMHREKFSEALERVLALVGDKFECNVHVAASRVLIGLLFDLHIPRFVSVVEQLIFKPNSNFRSGALKTFRDRLESVSKIDSASAEAIVEFAPKIGTLITTDDPDNLSIDAIVCLTGIVKHCRSESMRPLAVTLAEAVFGHGGLHSSDDSTQAVSLVCLTNMVARFKHHLIPTLPKTVPRSLELLEKCMQSETEYGVVHDHVIGFLEELVKNLPHFMGSYLDQILRLMYTSSVVMGDDDDGTVARVGFLNTIGNKMPVDVILRAYVTTWSQAVESGPVAVAEALVTMRVMEEHSRDVEMGSKERKKLFHKLDKPLLNLMILLLDIRNAPDFEDETITELEKQALEVIVRFVYRITGKLFKPMFLRIVEWASEDLASLSVTSTNRCAALWNLLTLLCNSLKSLITTYYGYALEKALEILKTDAIFYAHQHLWKSVMRSLRTGFQHDNHDFWQSPSVFSALVPLLVLQLTHATTPRSRNTVREFVYPAIAELASAVQGSEEHTKIVNSELLGHMASETADVKVAAVEALTAVYANVGEEWLSFLPESVPIIAELMENDDERVEVAMQLLLVGIEEHLGEGELEGMLA